MVGRLLDGRYQVRARIARGGMATVYLATDLRLDRRVAVKIMHPHLADDANFRERFIQEARSAARLAHTNVVNVFDQGQDDGLAYLVMEYLQGITLRDLLGEYGRLTADQTMDILEAVLAGLVAAHKAGIIHRDLKPENVLLADDGRIKIGDFGLARAATSHTASGQALLGTIAYLSPELVTRGIADTRSDIYAVGIMMYEMLVGEQPFRGEQPVQIAYQHANDSVPAPSLKNPEVPAALDDLTLWATARDPEQRPRDARAMLDQLFETQHLIREGRSGTGPQQRTTVLPATTTRVAPVEPRAPRPRERTAAVPVGAPARLALAAARAKKRGTWAFVAVLDRRPARRGRRMVVRRRARATPRRATRRPRDRQPAVALAGATVPTVPVPGRRRRDGDRPRRGCSSPPGSGSRARSTSRPAAPRGASSGSTAPTAPRCRGSPRFRGTPACGSSSRPAPRTSGRPPRRPAYRRVSSSATRNASSSDCMWFSRGSQSDS